MENKGSAEERRKARRRRRVLSQIFAYIFMLVIVALLAYGGYRLVTFLVTKIKAGDDAITVSEDAASESTSENGAGIIVTPDSIIEETENLLDEVSNNDADAEVVDEVVNEVTPDLPSEEEMAYIDGLSTEQKAAQLFVVTPESITGVASAIQAGNGTRTALSTYMVGGIAYDNRNVIDAEQFKTLINNTDDMYVELYNQHVFMLAVGNESIAQLTDDATEGTTVAGVYDGVKVAVLSPEFYVDGELSDGEIPDGTKVIVLPNVSVDEMTTDVPYSMSSILINDTIRATGYNGVVVTGFMDSEDVTSSYGAGEAAVLAISNGADMILRTENFDEAYQAVIDAINDGTISEERLNEALSHIYRLRNN